ncbi:MAG: helix-turn-helix domain-containing protein [Pseudomonadota bacterium]
MDSLITASARALAAGDALGALKRIALRDDPPALALRGIAMAQLGEHPRARELLRRATRKFGPHEAVSRARCVVAEAEVALAMRDIGAPSRSLVAAVQTLDAHGDRANSMQARLIIARRLLLIGRLEEAAIQLALVDPHVLSPALAAVAALAEAELELRSLHVEKAHDCLARAQRCAQAAQVPALLAEVRDARSALDRPAARRLVGTVTHGMRLDEVAALLASDALVVDGCRRGVCMGGTWQPLARRPILFALAHALARAWPGDAGRESLIEFAFRTRHPDETHRARLRVEIGRLRALVRSLARIEATPRGFMLAPWGEREVIVLEPPIEGEQAALLALLSDGAAWSTSALALALDASQRTVQRSLAELEAQGRVRSVGRARAQRWLAPALTGFTTILLLPASLPIE